MKSTNSLGALLLLLTALTACGEASYTERGPSVSPTPSGPVSFETDVVPVLRASSPRGCLGNGNCHVLTATHTLAAGALAMDSSGGMSATTLYANLVAGGGAQQSGLSLDIDTANVNQSLLLRKSLGLDGHGGSQIFSESSDDYAILLSWITAGARF